MGGITCMRKNNPDVSLPLKTKSIVSFINQPKLRAITINNYYEIDDNIVFKNLIYCEAVRRFYPGVVKIVPVSVLKIPSKVFKSICLNQGPFLQNKWIKWLFHTKAWFYKIIELTKKSGVNEKKDRYLIWRL